MGLFQADAKTTHVYSSVNPISLFQDRPNRGCPQCRQIDCEWIESFDNNPRKVSKAQCGEGKEAEKSGLQLKFRCEVTGQEWSNHIIC